MEIFLKIKHWQLFSIFFAIPVIIMFSLPDEVILDDSPENLKMSVVIMSFYLAIFLCWIVVLGGNLYKRASSLANFRIGFIFFVLSLCVVVAFFILIFWTIINFTHKTELPAFLFPTLVMGYLITLVCVFYYSSFLAKMLKVNELKRPVLNMECFGDTALFVFYPIGIWNIQPRINKLFNK